MRTHPGPKFWLLLYVILDLGSIWPYNAANAAVPLAAAMLGHLPGDATVTLMGWGVTEGLVVKLLGYVIFLLAFVPLVFGGAIYRMLEKIMAFKLVVVLGFLGFVTVFMVSRANVREVLQGFISVGTVPLRAETVIAGRHFTLAEHEPGRASFPDTVYTVKGTIENGEPKVFEFIEGDGQRIVSYPIDHEPTAELRQRREEMASRALNLTERFGFYIRTQDEDASLEIEGQISPEGIWLPTLYSFRDGPSVTRAEHLEDVPEPLRARCQTLAAYKGLDPANLAAYVAEHRRLPRLDWAMIASFAAIAGAGGMTNVMFSNYARDKGWGMGKHVGAIPSAVGGRQIELSHNGQVFIPNQESLPRWRGWMRHVIKDQLVVWMLASFVGMALPCMMSLEFIRNAPVKGDRVAAMTAEGIADRYPEYAAIMWPLTLLVGFLILAPGQMVASDLLARRWTDIYWNYSQRAKRMAGNQVKLVYYSILAGYGVFGLIALTFFNPLQVAVIAGLLQNIGLGVTALLALYVNRTLLPPALRPNAFMQSGTFLSGVFFMIISIVAVVMLMGR
ncbi:MAG: Nramp family divalent metal transporter [Pirellulales bacterium]